MSDQYTKTTREIDDYVGREYKNRSKGKSSFEQLTENVLAIPDDPVPGATQVTIRT